MTDPTRDLSLRLDKLERENRRLKRVGGSLLATVGIVGLLSMASPLVCKTVWGERFVLKDGSGHERMVLDAYSKDAPALVFKNRAGDPLARLKIGEEDVSLQVFREGEPVGAEFNLAPQDAGSDAQDSGEPGVD